MSPNVPGVPLTLTEPALTAWGKAIGRTATAPLVLCLRGDLGAGKSTLARAIARGAGVTGAIPSPTYNLMFRYDSPRDLRLVHMDLYRLEDPEEVWELGWGELPADDEIVMIEWPERAEHLLPEPRWEIRIEETDSHDTRQITMEPIGDLLPLPLPDHASGERTDVEEEAG